MDASETKKYAGRMTEDQKRRIRGEAGDAAGLTQVGGQLEDAGEAEQGQGDRDASEMGICEECGKTAMGAVDMSVDSFFCNSCWAAFPLGAGDAAEGDEGLAPVAEDEEGEAGEGGYDDGTAVQDTSFRIKGGILSSRASGSAPGA